MGVTFDNFEDNDWAEYNLERGSSSYVDTVTSPVYDGSHTLEISISNGENTSIVSESGLDYYPQPGETFYCYVRSDTTSTNQQCKIGYGQSSGFVGGDGYAIDVRFGDGQVNIDRYDDGNGSTLAGVSASLSANEWFEVEINWGTEGTHDVYVRDSGGNVVANPSTTDSTYGKGGLGFSTQSLGSTTGWYDYYHTPDARAPSEPRNVSLNIAANDQADLSWDEPSEWGVERGDYRVQISRDGTSYQSPSGGSSIVNDDGSSSYSESYTPSSDTDYYRQVGIDSTFRFRVRAENSFADSSWSYSSTKYTGPIAPHDPAINRPDGDTVELSATMQSDIPDRVVVQYREDTGSGYGGWSWFDMWHSSDSHVAGDPSLAGERVTATYKIGTSYQSGNALQSDARYQFRLRTRSPSGDDSAWVFADYGNDGGVLFEDDFESGDLSAWDVVSLSDGDSGVTTNGHPDGPNGPDEGSDSLRLDAMDYVQQNLGDLSSASDVFVRCAISVGSMDYDGEGFSVKWYDGSSWQRLQDFEWEYNQDGWVEVHANVPSSYLSTDNRVRFRGYGNLGGGDHAGVDRVVVADVLDEYTTPVDPSSLSIDASVKDELTASWTNNQTFGYPATWRNNTLDESRTNGTEHSSGASSRTDGGLRDGERYQFEVEARVRQYRRGAVDTRLVSANSIYAEATTILPAPSDLTVDVVGAESADISWVDNHDYGDVRLEIKRSSPSTWSTDGTVSRGTEAYIYSSLLNGEEYDVRVFAQTEHTETRDQ